MKKLLLFLAGFVVTATINAQSLEEIVSKYTVANKLDQVSKLKTIKLTAKMSMMGMDMPMQMWMKNPNKIKTVTSMSGQDMMQVFDGEKGYSINPMAGSSTPVEMTPDQVKTTLRNNMFQNYMANYLKNGQLKLTGEEKVNDKPAFKLQATVEGGVVVDIYIDKASFFIVKTSVTSSGMTIDSFPTDYKETNGVIVPMKTTSSASGMDMVLTFTNVEVDIPMDDSVFKVK